MTAGAAGALRAARSSGRRRIKGTGNLEGRQGREGVTGEAPTPESIMIIWEDLLSHFSVSD